MEAKTKLRFPPVEINGIQAVTVVEGFKKACTEGGYLVHACAVLPVHVHLVVGIHPRAIRQIVGHLRSRATSLLKERGLWVFDQGRPIWGEHGWNVRLEDEQAVLRAIRYVELNPIKEGKKRQDWSIVTPFDLQIARLSASQATRLKKPRRIGGAALLSMQQKRKRMGR